jgi:hypothetical protein
VQTNSRKITSVFPGGELPAETLEPYALEHADKNDSGDWEFKDGVYARLGYNLIGNRAERPPRPFPFTR